VSTRRFVSLVVMACLLAGIMACGTTTTPSQGVPTALVTFAPAFLPTAQSAQANAQSTIAAGAAQVAAIAPQLTAAVATDNRAGELTSTAQWEAQLTASAETEQAQQTASAGTAMAAAAATATQQATETQVMGTAFALTITQSAAQTLTAWPPAATQTQAAMNEDARRDRQRELESLLTLGATVFWFVLWPTVTVLVVIGLVIAYRRLLPAVNIWLRKHREQGGQTYFTAGDGEHVIDVMVPERSFGAALRRTPSGVSTQAIAPDPAMQAQVDYAALLVLIGRALGPGRAQALRRLMRSGLPQPQEQEPRYTVLVQPGESLQLTPPTVDALEADWRNDDEQ